MLNPFLQKFITLLLFVAASFGLSAEEKFSTFKASQSEVFDKQKDWNQFFFDEGKFIGSEIVALDSAIFDLRRRAAGRPIDLKPFIGRLDVLRQKLIDLKNLKQAVYSLGKLHIKDFNLGVRPDKFEPYTEHSGIYPNSGPYIIRRSEEVGDPVGNFLGKSFLFFVGGGSALTGLYHTISGADFSKPEAIILSLYVGGIAGVNFFKWLSLNHKFINGREVLLEKVEKFWKGEAEFARGLRETNFLIPHNFTSIDDILLWLSFRISSMESSEGPAYSQEITAEAIRTTMRESEDRTGSFVRAFYSLGPDPEAKRLESVFEKARSPGEDWMRGRPKLNTDFWFLRERAFLKEARAIVPWLSRLNRHMDAFECKGAIMQMIDGDGGRELFGRE